MRSTGDESSTPLQAGGRSEPPVQHPLVSGSEELRLRVQQRSLREQLERHHFLLERLNNASARLIQSLERGDVFEAITEIIAKLIGAQEIAIFNYYPAKEAFALASSRGIEASALQSFESGAGMFGRTVHMGMSQFRERQPMGVLLPYEQNLTACVILKSSVGVAGVIAIFGLPPEKNGLEWADFELLKFLETYAAVALQFQRLQEKYAS
jgi:hypothetical protein